MYFSSIKIFNQLRINYHSNQGAFGLDYMWLLVFQKTIVEQRLHALKSHGIASRDYWTMVGCKAEIAQL